MFIASCWLIYVLVILAKLLGHITVSWLGIFTPIIILFTISVFQVFRAIRKAQKERDAIIRNREAFLFIMKNLKKK